MKISSLRIRSPTTAMPARRPFWRMSSTEVPSAIACSVSSLTPGVPGSPSTELTSARPTMTLVAISSRLTTISLLSVRARSVSRAARGEALPARVDDLRHRRRHVVGQGFDDVRLQDLCDTRSGAVTRSRTARLLPALARLAVHERGVPELAAEVLERVTVPEELPADADGPDDVEREALLVDGQPLQEALAHAGHLVREDDGLGRVREAALEHARVVDEVDAGQHRREDVAGHLGGGRPARGRCGA